MVPKERSQLLPNHAQNHRRRRGDPGQGQKNVKGNLGQNQGLKGHAQGQNQNIPVNDGQDPGQNIDVQDLGQRIDVGVPDLGQGLSTDVPGQDHDLEKPEDHLLLIGFGEANMEILMHISI